MLLVGQRGIEIYPIMRLITIPCSFFSAALFFGGCSDSQRPKGPNELLDDEIRGRVVSVDLNKSLVSVEVIGAGQMLDGEFSQTANNRLTFFPFHLYLLTFFLKSLFLLLMLVGVLT